MALNGMRGTASSYPEEMSRRQVHENAVQQKASSSVSTSPMQPGIGATRNVPGLPTTPSPSGNLGMNKKLGGG
jgi:hypothetical protein